MFTGLPAAVIQPAAFVANALLGQTEHYFTQKNEIITYVLGPLITSHHITQFHTDRKDKVNPLMTDE